MPKARPRHLLCVTNENEELSGHQSVVRRTSTILLRQVGEAPDVAQPHGVAYGSQQEGKFAVPGLSLLLALLRLEDRLALTRPHHLGVQPRRRL